MSEVLPLPLPWRTVTNDRRVSVLAANGLVVTEIFGTALYRRKQEIADMIVAAANGTPKTQVVEIWASYAGPCRNCINGACTGYCAFENVVVSGR